MNHFATYDILSLTIKLEKQLGDVSLDEIQMFAYLACILSIYDGQRANDWGYSFIKNEYGSPYNGNLQNIIDLFYQNDTLTFSNEYFKTNKVSIKKFEIIKKLIIYTEREQFLSASTKCIKFIPYSSVWQAIFKEPTLFIAKQNTDRKLLLDSEGASIHLLYEQFEYLRCALENNYKNLVIPALIWMTHNTEIKKDDNV